MIIKTNEGYTTKDKRIAAQYEFDNADYLRKRKMNIQAPKTYKYTVFDRKKKAWFLPQSCKHFMPNKIMDLSDKTHEHKVSFNFNATLRDDQQKIVDWYQGKDMGLIIAPTAFGKSFVIAGLINQVAKRTLVVAPRVAIAKQLHEKYETIFGKDEVCYFNSKMGPSDFKKICIVVGNSFNKYREHLQKIYPVVIIDEIHIGLMSDGRKTALCKYKFDNFYGLTATPERDEVGFEIFEKIFYNIYDVGAKPITPQIYKYSYSNDSMYYTGWADMVQQLNGNPKRLNVIANMIKETMKHKRNMGLALMETIEVTEKLTKELQQLGVHAEAITGKVKPETRDELLKKVEENNGVLVATYQTVGTGFDYPPLDTLFYLIHVKFKGTIKQAVGRILRKYDDKCHPVMIDWHDKETQGQNRTRERTLKKYFEIKEVEPFYNFIAQQHEKLF